MKNADILVLGAGDLATGVIRRLHIAGARVVATELPAPLTVRRQVSFSEAVHAGSMEVEGVTAVLCKRSAIEKALACGNVAIIVDPSAAIRTEMAFDAIVDARMAKTNLGIRKDHAPVVIAVGPGFTAGEDCHAVVETLQGAGMGRAIFDGSACADTGEPCPLNHMGGLPSGLNPESRVLRAPADGAVREIAKIGDAVAAGQVVAKVGSADVISPFGGVLRGMVRSGTEVSHGLKIGEVDLSGKKSRCFMISEKANAVAGGVLEALHNLLPGYGRRTI